MAYTGLKGDGHWLFCFVFETEILLEKKKHFWSVSLFLQNKQQAAYNLITEGAHTPHPQPPSPFGRSGPVNQESRKDTGSGKRTESNTQIAIQKLEVRGEK